MRRMQWFLSFLLPCPVLLAQQSQPSQVAPGIAGQQLSPANSLAAWHPNGIVDATLFPGRELGAQVAAAQAQLAGDCGTILIPHGEYQWTSSVTLNPCVTLEGNGAIVNVRPTGTTPFLIIAAAPLPSSAPNFDAHVLTQGGLANITFKGPGPSHTETIGVWYGGDQKGVLTPRNFIAAIDTFTNVHLTGFGTAIVYTPLGFQTTWTAGIIENNNVGIGFQTGVHGGIENLSFHGTEILNNIQFGILQTDASDYFELNCFGCSLDYNGQTYKPGAQAQFMNATANFFGGHMEGPYAPFIRLPQPPSPANVQLTLDTVDFNNIDLNAADTYDGFIENYGYGSAIFLNGYNNFGSQGAQIPQIVFNSPTAGAPTTILADPYLSNIMSSTSTFPVLWGNRAPDVYSYWTRTGQGIGTIGTHVDNMQHNFTKLLVSGNLTVTALSAGHIDNNAGMQNLPGQPGCTIPANAAPGAACTTTVTLSYPEPDANYTQQCGLHNSTGAVFLSNYRNLSTSQFTVDTIAVAASTTAQGSGGLQCTVFH